MVAPLHVYHPLAAAIRERLLERFPGRQIVSCATFDELAAHIADIEILLTGVLPKQLLSKATKLRWIQYMGAGVDTLLPAPNLKAGVEITCARGLFAAQVAEHGIGLLLSLHRGFASHHLSQLEAQWRPFASSSLAGKTLVVLGLGEIGHRVARIAVAMAMNVVGVTRTGTSDHDVDGIALIRPRDELHDALADADAVILTVPLTEQTHHVMAKAALEAMKPSALLVNIGRGLLVDEQALLVCLENGHLGGAALDVFRTEPLPLEHPLWTAPNTIVTPHCSGTSVGGLEAVGAFFADNVARFDEGLPLLNQVERERGY